MVVIVKRSGYLPHHGFIVHNSSATTKVVRLSPESRARCLIVDRVVRNHQELLPQVNYDVQFKYEDQLQDGEEYLKTHIVEPGHQLTFVFEGGIQAPPDFKEELLRAVDLPFYGLSVPSINTTIFLEYRNAAAKEDLPLAQQCYHQEAHDEWQMTSMSIQSVYTHQNVPCSFRYTVSVTAEDEEIRRCCLLHVPQYHQNTFLFYPHQLPYRMGHFRDVKRSCQCCD
jgi:hypothetical protein